MEYEYKSFLKALGKRVKQLRLERGWTQWHVVLTFGFHDTYWRKIERGQGISIPTLLKLAGLFNITLEELVQGLSDQLRVTSAADGSHVETPP
jgi:transcriptional regulator with XRE-family HTH domain